MVAERWRFSWMSWLGAPFFLVVLAPPVALVVRAASALVQGHTEAFSLAVPSARRLGLLASSVLFAAVATGAATLVGILAGLALQRWRRSRFSSLRWLVLVLAPLPPYIHALAWSALGAQVNRTFGLALPMALPVDGWLAALWVQSMALLPLSTGMALIGLESVDPVLLDAARVFRANGGAVARVHVGLAAPAILAGSGLAFVLCLTDFTVPSLLGVDVYALEVFAEYGASSDPVRALMLSVPLVAVASGAVIALQPQIRRLAEDLGPALRPPTAVTTWPTWLRWAQGAALGICVMQVLVPLLLLVVETRTPTALGASLASSGSDLIDTLLIASISCLVAVLAGIYPAVRLARGRGVAVIWWSAVLAPLAVPAPLVGVGLVALWNHALTESVYASRLMPVLASAARFTPLAVLVVLSQMRRIDPLLIDAARAFVRERWRRWFRIDLPLIAPGVVAAACVVFALAVGELGATLVVMPPGRSTVTVRVYGYLHVGASESVAGLCLVVTLVTLGAGVLGWASWRAWSMRAYGRKGEVR